MSTSLVDVRAVVCGICFVVRCLDQWLTKSRLLFGSIVGLNGEQVRALILGTPGKICIETSAESV